MTTLQKMTATAYAAATTDPGGSGTESDKKVSVGRPNAEMNPNIISQNTVLNPNIMLAVVTLSE